LFSYSLHIAGNEDVPSKVTYESQSRSTSMATLACLRRRQILKARAVELYHRARSAQQHEQRAFEDQYGRADRIDAPLLAELQPPPDALRRESPPASNASLPATSLKSIAS